jgi:hypothetical protein
MTDRNWHIFVHALDPALAPKTSGAIDGVATLEVPAAAVNGPFALTFEQVAAGIAALPGAWVEPDGALVWNPRQGGQIAGTLHCLDHRVLSLELYVSCRGEAWRDFCSAGLGESAICIQLAEHGSFVSSEGLACLLDARSG